MPILTAADAISPAIYRTRQFLFAPPFRWSTFLKLCLVAAVTEGLGSNFNSNLNKHGGGHTPSSPNNIIYHFTPEMIAAIVAAVIGVIIIGLLIGYLITRLRFAYFHCLIHNTRQLRPGWELYSSQAGRFFWMNIAVAICFLLVVGAVLLPFAAGFWRFFQGIQAGNEPNWGLLISLVVPLIPLLIVIFLVALMSDIVLRDWMLPHYALEDATAGEAWHSVWSRIKNEKKQFFVYSILRVIAPIVAGIILFLVLIIPGAVSVGGVAAAEYAVHTAFAASTGSATVVGIALEVFIGIIAFAFVVVVGISLGGPVSTGLREYALLFYGARYEVLESVLFPPASPIAPGSPAD